MATIDQKTGSIVYNPGEQYQGGSAVKNMQTGLYEMPKFVDNSVMYNPAGAPTKMATDFKPASEPSVISTDSGRAALDQSIVDHSKDLASVSASKTTQTAGTGYTADELKSAGADFSKYSYNSDTQKFTEIPGADGLKKEYENDTRDINGAFSGILSKMDAATDAYISSIKGVFGARIDAMRDVNARELQAYNTMNIRSGTDRYAPGVAQSIITADEREGLKRIAGIESEMLSKINEAQQNLDSKKYQAFLQNRQEISTLKANYKTELKDLKTAAQKETDARIKRKQDLEDNFNTFKQDAFKTAKEYGAPSANLSAISKATNMEELAAASAGYGGNKNLNIQKIGDNLVVFDTNTNKIVKTLDVSGIGNTDGSKLPVKDFKDFMVGLTPEGATNFTQLSDRDKSSVSQLINGDALLSDIMASRGVQGSEARQRLLQLAQSVDPNFSENTNKVRYEFMKKWNDPANNIGMTRNAINTALGHLAEVKNLSDKLSPSAIKVLNSVDNFWSKQTGDPEVTNFRIAAQALASEMARVYKGGVPNEGEINEYKNLIADNFSKSQYKGIADTAASLLSSKITSTRYQYSSAMGKEYKQSLIDPDKRQELINAGIDPKAIVKEKVPGQNNNPLGSAIDSSRTQGKKDDEIVGYLKTQDGWGDYVNRLLAVPGATPTSVLDYLKENY